MPDDAPPGAFEAKLTTARVTVSGFTMVRALIEVQHEGVRIGPELGSSELRA